MAIRQEALSSHPALSYAEDYCIMTWTFLWSLGLGYWHIDIPWSAQTRLNFRPNTEVTAFEGNTSEQPPSVALLGWRVESPLLTSEQFKRCETWVYQVHTAVFVCWCLEKSLSYCSSWSLWLLEPRVQSFWQMSEHQQLYEDNERHPVMWHGEKYFFAFLASAGLWIWLIKDSNYLSFLKWSSREKNILKQMKKVKLGFILPTWRFSGPGSCFLFFKWIAAL